MVVTHDEVARFEWRYGLLVCRSPDGSEGKAYVFGPGGNHFKCCNLDLDTMTPDEFESLVLPMVVEGTFCS